MERSNFENLRVYKLSEELADSICEIVNSWDGFSLDTIGKQIVRSADSVGVNIAEGVGRYGTQDNKRFAYFARGSLNETKHWLRRAFKRGLLTEAQVEFLKPIVEKLAPSLNAYINSIKAVKGTTNNERRTTNKANA